mmetsp:Transcript_53762/g.108011  ORF Transcript_53762/g.108011 Transcript_53762/m.108011 type:complete len:290 (-) Transcript_53762:227-1096(-)
MPGSEDNNMEDLLGTFEIQDEDRREIEERQRLAIEQAIAERAQAERVDREYHHAEQMAGLDRDEQVQQRQLDEQRLADAQQQDVAQEQQGGYEEQPAPQQQEGYYEEQPAPNRAGNMFNGLLAFQGAGGTDANQTLALSSLFENPESMLRLVVGRETQSALQIARQRIDEERTETKAGIHSASQIPSEQGICKFNTQDNSALPREPCNGPLYQNLAAWKHAALQVADSVHASSIQDLTPRNNNNKRPRFAGATKMNRFCATCFPRYRARVEAQRHALALQAAADNNADA